MWQYRCYIALKDVKLRCPAVMARVKSKDARVRPCFASAAIRHTKILRNFGHFLDFEY